MTTTMTRIEAACLAKQIADCIAWHHGGQGFAIRIQDLPGLPLAVCLTIGGCFLYHFLSEEDWEGQKTGIIRTHSTHI